MRDRHARPLEYGAIAQYAAFAPAAFGPFPQVALKFHRIDIFQCRGDAILQSAQVAFDRGRVCRLSHYVFFFAGLFLALAFAALGFAFAGAAGFTGACLFTAVFLPLAASFTRTGAEAGACGAVCAPCPPFAAFTAAFGANLPPLPPLRPHLPRSGAAASRARHS